MLTASLKAIYIKNKELYKLCCYDAFFKMTVENFPVYKKHRRETDKCSWCHRYKTEIIPQFEADLKQVKLKLEALYGEYFVALEKRKVYSEHCLNPVRKARMHRIYIDEILTEEVKPDAVNNWKLGLSTGQRLDLHAEEARAVHLLGKHCDVIQDFAWHRSGARRQGEFLRNLLEKPPLNERVVLSDWKAYFDLPFGAIGTTQMEFATSQKPVSILGAVVVSWSEKGEMEKTRLFLVTEVLDHTAEVPT